MSLDLSILVARHSDARRITEPKPWFGNERLFCSVELPATKSEFMYLLKRDCYGGDVPDSLDEADLPKAPKLKALKSINPKCVVERQTDEGWEKTTKDPYGSKLKWTTAGDLRQVCQYFLTHPCSREDFSYASAAAAYVNALPAHVIVVLYWH